MGMRAKKGGFFPWCSTATKGEMATGEGPHFGTLETPGLGLLGFQMWDNLIFGSWENWVVSVPLTSIAICPSEGT